MAETKTAADTTLPAITERPTFLVHRMNAELTRICNPLFRRLGVDIITSRLLVILLERRHAYVSDIVDLMSLPQSTVSHQIKRLQAAGLVTRTTDAADNRAVVVKLTRQGRNIASQCNAISSAIYADLFAQSDPTELAQVVSYLQRTTDKLKTMTAANLNLES